MCDFGDVPGKSPADRGPGRRVASLRRCLADHVVDLSDPAFVADPYPAFDRHPGGWARGLARGARAVPGRSGTTTPTPCCATGGSGGCSRRGSRTTSGRPSTGCTPTRSWTASRPSTPGCAALVAKAFARGHVERLRPRVRELAGGLLDDAERRAGRGGTVDLIADYAEPLPVMVIAELLGVPEPDRPLLRPWSQAIVKMYEYDRTPAAGGRTRARPAAEFSAYVAELARAAPGRAGRRPGQPPRRRSRTGASGCPSASWSRPACCCSTPGTRRRVNGFGNGVAALFRNPRPARACSSPTRGARAPTAVEEMLRYDAPLQLFERTAKKDVEVAGVQLRAGEKIAAAARLGEPRPGGLRGRRT